MRPKTQRRPNHNRVGFRLYEHFRPEVPPDVRGCGAKGVLEIEKIRTAGERFY